MLPENYFLEHFIEIDKRMITFIVFKCWHHIRHGKVYKYAELCKYIFINYVLSYELACLKKTRQINS